MILAKKNKSNKEQNLFEHSLDVYEKIKKDIENETYNFNNFENYLSKKRFEDCFEQKVLNKKQLNIFFKKIFFIISFFHDLGKIDDSFQNYIKKDEKSENIINHAIYSYLIFKDLNIKNNCFINDEILEWISYAILYHHSFSSDVDKKIIKIINGKDDKKREFRKQIFKNIENIIEKNEYNEYLKKIEEKYFEEFNEEIFFKNKFNDDLFRDVLRYKDFEEINNDKINKNALLTFIRFVFNKADRLVSHNFENENLTNKNHFNIDEYYKKDFSKLDDFDKNERTKKQDEKIEEIINLFNKEKVAILDGAPGVGKTRMFLKTFAELNKKQLYIITPRNTIAEGLFKEFETLTYFNENITFELLNSQNQIKFKNKEIIELEENDFYKSNIVIISIDRLINIFNENYLISNFLNTTESLIVFDEFHEIYEQNFLTVYFKEFMQVLTSFNSSSILLTSGTTSPILSKEILNLKNDNFVKIDSFNQEKIHLYFLNASDQFKKQDFIKNRQKIFNLEYKKTIQENLVNRNEGFIDIYNKVENSQIAIINFLQNFEKENVDIFNIHSYFDKEEKNNIINEILKNFRTIYQNHEQNKGIIFSGPILQASLNITTKNMFTNYTSPENFLQRIGRLNRKGEKLISNLFICYEDKDVTKTQKKTRVSLQNNINEKFNIYICEKFEKQIIKSNYLCFSITINDLRQLYYKFYEDHKNEIIEIVEKIYEDVEEDGSKYKKDVFPFIYQNESNKKQININKKTLRGMSGFQIKCSQKTLNLNEDNVLIEENNIFETSVPLEKMKKIKSFLNKVENKDFKKSLLYQKYQKESNKDICSIKDIRDITLLSNDIKENKSYKIDFSLFSFNDVLKAINNKDDLDKVHFSFLKVIKNKKIYTLGLIKTIILQNFVFIKNKIK